MELIQTETIGTMLNRIEKISCRMARSLYGAMPFRKTGTEKERECVTRRVNALESEHQRHRKETETVSPLPPIGSSTTRKGRMLTFTRATLFLFVFFGLLDVVESLKYKCTAPDCFALDKEVISLTQDKMPLECPHCKQNTLIQIAEHRCNLIRDPNMMVINYQLEEFPDVPDGPSARTAAVKIKTLTRHCRDCGAETKISGKSLNAFDLDSDLLVRPDSFSPEEWDDYNKLKKDGSISNRTCIDCSKCGKPVYARSYGESIMIQRAMQRSQHN